MADVSEAKVCACSNYALPIANRRYSSLQNCVTFAIRGALLCSRLARWRFGLRSVGLMSEVWGR